MYIFGPKRSKIEYYAGKLHQKFRFARNFSMIFGPKLTNQNSVFIENFVTIKVCHNSTSVILRVVLVQLSQKVCQNSVF